MHVFELVEVPEPMIVMDYYPGGNIEDVTDLSKEDYITATGQILDGLSHLHARGVAHRDLKPQNFMIEQQPLLRVVITDFGMAKIALTPTALQTFCGTLQYVAPESFPGVGNGHGTQVDVWSLGVIVMEWLYGIPKPPALPAPRNGQRPTEADWARWSREWTAQLVSKVGGIEEDQVIAVLVHMLQPERRRRWDAKKCLDQGFRSRLFKRRPVDGLVVCAKDQSSFSESADEEDAGRETLAVTASPASALARGDLVDSIVEGHLW